MTAISNAILKTKNRLALIPFVTVGYPNLSITQQIIYLLNEEEVDAIELGIPYSDSLADGPVIQQASSIALDKKVYIDQVLDCVKQVNPNIKIPIIIFTYFNPIVSYGVHKFIFTVANNGAKGLVIPDLPLEESDYIISLCNYYNIELILFVAPTSSLSRVQAIISKAPGLIYLVSSYGVTGSKQVWKNKSILQFIAKSIKDKISRPIVLGFGLSTAKDIYSIRMNKLNIDGVVVGSAFTRKITESYIHSHNLYNVKIFCREIISALR